MATVPTSSHGGGTPGFDPSTSWLEAANAASPTINADGTVYVIQWGSVLGSAGSDIAIHAGDNTKIDILTSGTYCVFLIAAPTLSGAVAGGTFECYSMETFDFAGETNVPVPVALTTHPFSQSASEPRAITAPASLRFGADLTSDGATPTWVMTTAKLWVQRLY